jgi:hypothetical protein
MRRLAGSDPIEDRRQMTDSSPDDLLSAISSDLIFVTFGNTAEALEVVDRLADLEGDVQDRFAFEKAYGEALLLAGRPAAARTRLDAAFRRRTEVPPEFRGELSLNLAHAGLAEPARQALAEYRATWNSSDDDFEALYSDLAGAAQSALWLGDLETLERAAVVPDQWNQAELGELCLNAIRAGGLGELYTRHQALVIEHLAPDQYWFDIVPDIEDGEDSHLIVMVHYLDADRADCRAREDRLFDALDDLHRSFGSGAGSYLGRFLNHVVSLPCLEDGAS